MIDCSFFNFHCEAIADCCDRLGWDEVQRQAWLRGVFGKQSRSLLTDHQLELALMKLRRMVVYYGNPPL